MSLQSLAKTIMRLQMLCRRAVSPKLAEPCPEVRGVKAYEVVQTYCIT